MLEILNRWGSGFSTSAPPRAALLIFFMYIENKILVPRKDSELLKKKKKRWAGRERKPLGKIVILSFRGPYKLVSHYSFPQSFAQTSLI